MVHLLTALLLVLISPLVSSLNITPDRAGPYRIIVREIGNCTRDVSTATGGFLEIQSTHPKAGQPQHVWGRIITLVAFTDAQQLVINLDRRMNDAWRRAIFVFRFNKACTSLKRLSPTLVKTLFGSDWNQCPLPPAERLVKNQTMNVHFPEIPVFPYGRWLANCKVVQKGKDIGCFRADVDVIPKKIGSDT